MWALDKKAVGVTLLALSECKALATPSANELVVWFVVHLSLSSSIAQIAALVKGRGPEWYGLRTVLGIATPTTVVRSQAASRA